MEYGTLCEYAGEQASVRMFVEEGGDVGCLALLLSVSLILLKQNKLSHLSLLELGWWLSNPPVPAFPTVLGL